MRTVHTARLLHICCQWKLSSARQQEGDVTSGHSDCSSIWGNEKPVLWESREIRQVDQVDLWFHWKAQALTFSRAPYRVEWRLADCSLLWRGTVSFGRNVRTNTSPLKFLLNTFFSCTLKMEVAVSWRQCAEWNRSLRPTSFVMFRGFTAMTMKMSSTVWHCIVWLNLQTFRTNILPPYSG